MSTKLGSLTLDLICRTGRFTQGMRDASNSASREMGRIESSTQTVNSMLKQLATTAAATFTVSQVVNYADSYTGMVNKLKLVTTTQTELSRAMSDTHQIAQGTASDWSGVVDVYTKFQKISDRLGLSQKEVARITETVTKSVSMSGASADEAQRSLIQFSQGLSLGVLRGQDLNSVMQQTPGLTDAIAKGMGVTSDKLKQMGADNVLTTESVVTALKKVADSVDEEYAKTATTVASSFNLIKNESIRMVGEFDSATGASAKFVQGMTVLSQNMDTVTNTLMIGGAYMAGTYIPVLATTTIGFIKSSVEAVRYQVALAGMQASATGASRTLVVLKGVLGGPAGLGIMVASVAAGFLLMRDSSKDTQSALEEQGLTVDELKVKYSQLNAEQLKLKALGASDAIEAENEKIRTLFISLERYISDLNGQGNTDRANALQQYLEDLKVGGDRAKNAFARLEKQRVVNPEDIAYAAKMGA
ncbi:tape measure protein, partial [Acinetobacter guillouiae]|uniref:tape measure protein n=1 Tax=Acinetobacter guillouiae TaxID=106649 RepID=UPI003AF7D0D4